MIRLFTAAALTVLLATPAMAQSVSPGDSSGSTLQNQGSQSQTAPDVPSRGAGQIPADCTPTDARPECQTAQVPGQDSPRGSMSDQSGGAGVMTPPARESDQGSSTWQGGGQSSPGSSGSGGMGR